MITFFVGGIAELCYISVYGSYSYVRNLQDLYNMFAVNNPVLKKIFRATPLWQRYQILQAMGMVPESLSTVEEQNVNEVLL